MTEPRADTSDLRRGAPVSDDLLALLPLVGVWQGDGVGRDPATGDFVAFTQSLHIAHDGRPFLVHATRSWRADGSPGPRENGFWRIVGGPDDVALVVVGDDGQAVVLAGTAGDTQWDLTATAAVAAPGGPSIDAQRRLYALVDDELVCITETAPAGENPATVLNIRLARV